MELVKFKTVHLGSDEKIQEREGYEIIIHGRIMYLHESAEIDPEQEEFIWSITDGETGAVFNKFKSHDKSELIEYLKNSISTRTEEFEIALDKVRDQLKSAGIEYPLNPAVKNNRA